MEINNNNIFNNNIILSENNFDNINQYCPKVSLEQKIKNLEYQNIKNIISNLNEKILTYENMMRINKIPIPQQIINHDIQFIKQNENQIINSKLPKRLNKKDKKNDFNIINKINNNHIIKNKNIQNLESDDLINLKEENDFRIGNLHIDLLNDNFIDEPNEIIKVDLSNNLFNDFICNVNNIDNMTYEELLDLENKIGYVKKGISLRKKLGLKKEKYSSKKFHYKECVICKEILKEKEKIRVLNCFHIFHINCIDKWFKDNKTCPICKKEV